MDDDTSATVVLAIHPRWSRLILAGAKTAELRRRAPSGPVGRLVIYETAPVSSIVGVANVTGIESGAAGDVWATCGAASMVPRREYDAYYSGRSRAFAYLLADATALATPLTLADAGLRSAPQSFAYVDESSTSSALADALTGLAAVRT
jgi:predicted transcriptional regulator